MTDTVTTVAPGVECLALRTPTLPPATTTNTYLVGAGGAFFVVEPATPHGRERNVLFERVRQRVVGGERLLGAVLTHHHRDHVGAAAAFRTEFGAPVFAHPLTAARLSEVVTVDRLLVEGDELLGGALRVLHTPGHAPGHVCLMHAADAWLIAGDMVASVGTVVVDPDDDGDMAQYVAQLGRLAALRLRTLLPAHGAPVADPGACLGFYLTHRRAREAKVLAAVRAAGDGADLAAVIRVAYDDTPAWLWPLAGKSARAHLVKLADEGQVVARGEQWVARPDA